MGGGNPPWRLRALVAVLGVVFVGYGSSLLSRHQAEQVTANRIADELGTREVFVLVSDPSSPFDYPKSNEALSRTGFSIRRCEQTREEFNCFPWAGMSPSEVLGPFLVEVRWGADRGGLSGYGARTRYLVFFGLVVTIRDVDAWAS